MASHLGREQLRKKAPILIVLTVAIAATILISLEVLQRTFINSSSLTSDFLVTSIVAVTRNVTDVMRSFGYVGVFLLMLLDASSFPIPSEMILPFAGYLVFRGDMNFFAVAAVATIAGVGGSLIDYYIGMKGAHILKQHHILGKVLFSENQLNIAISWFNRYGSIMVFVSRLIPIFRTLVSFPAGAVRMPIKKFIAYTALGSLAWNGLLIYIGHFLGTKWVQVVDILNYLVVGVIVTSAFVFVAYFAWRRHRIAASKKATTSDTMYL